MKNLFVCFGFAAALCCFNYSTASAQLAPSVVWAHTYGGDNDDGLKCIQQTRDGGFVFAGISNSTNGDVTGNHGGNDYWVVKLNHEGGIQWSKCYGGSGDDETNSIAQTRDGGYIVAGLSDSHDGEVTGNHGDFDYWLVKLDPSGAIQWQKSLGGKGDDQATCVQQTLDDGYIVAGWSKSRDGDVKKHHGDTANADYWIVKLSPSGAIQWSKSYGGSADDFATDIHQTTDGGYIVAGFSSSLDGDVKGRHHGGLTSDDWILKLSPTGAIQWSKCYGGSNYDCAMSIQQTTDGGYVVAGYTSSYDGDVTGIHGKDDYWVLKLSYDGALQWEKTYGGSAGDLAYSVRQTADGGFIVGGWSESHDGDVAVHIEARDFWIIKLSPGGTLVWQKTLGGKKNDIVSSMQLTADGGCVVAGWTTSVDGDVVGNHGGWDAWVVVLSP